MLLRPCKKNGRILDLKTLNSLKQYKASIFTRNKAKFSVTDRSKSDLVQSQAVDTSTKLLLFHNDFKQFKFINHRFLFGVIRLGILPNTSHPKINQSIQLNIILLKFCQIRFLPVNNSFFMEDE